MPINRVPFDALVDDDGTGETGTVWNKQQIKDVLLDPIDALVPGATAGADKQVQFNDGGVIKGDPQLTFDKATGQLRPATILLNGGSIIGQNTTPGADATGITLSGSSNYAPSRGSQIVVTGNQHTAKGGIWLIAGMPDGVIQFMRGIDNFVALELDKLGIVQLRAGQIAFPATANPSPNANTLDDYREGAWTPVFLGTGGQSGQTYSLNAGVYTKIGRQVTAHCYLALSNAGTFSGTILLGGLPFPGSAASIHQAATISYWANVLRAWTYISGYLPQGDSRIILQGALAASQNSVAMTPGDMTNATAFILGITYMTD